MMPKTLSGIAASPGIAIAKAYRMQKRQYVPEKRSAARPAAEADRFRQAVSEAKQRIQQIRDQAEARMGAGKAEIFEGHLLLLEDPELIDVVIERIEREAEHAEYALYTVTMNVVELLQSLDNELLKERAEDVKDVSGRIMDLLRNVQSSSISNITEEVIIVCDDLTPSDTAQLNLQYVKGFVAGTGGRTSHSAIMARSLGIPSIVGAGAAVHDIVPGEIVILDAIDNLVIVSPEADQLDAFRLKQAQHDRRRERLAKWKDECTITKDGKQMMLAANIGGIEDLQKAIDNGAEGIGLLRTEFLYMGRDSLPSEEEQFQLYKSVLDKMAGKPVVIRTLDIGGDKALDYMKLPEESNPFLGLRAIRLCLQREQLFRSQLRALLRAGRFGRLKLLFPMITVLEELLEAKRLLQEEKERLLREGEAVAECLEVGVMIEVPAAALCADALAKEADFFSIGTNDLIQYAMAADRMNEAVAHLYQPCHPAMLRLIRMIVRAARQEGKHVGMCGEMAGDETAIPLLLGLGLHELSMSASAILPARASICMLDQAEWAAHADNAATMQTENEVTEYVRERIRGA